MKIATRIIVLLVIVSSISTFSDGFEGQRVEGDPDLESYLREALENFREQMKTGIEAIKMPVLDPLVLKHLVVKVKEDAAVLDLIIHEVSIEGLSNFTLPYLLASLEELYVNLTIEIPLLLAHGQYNLSGVIYHIFPIYGYGPILLTATDVIASGTGQLQFIEQDLLQMTTLDLDLDWSNMTTDLGNFLGGGNLQKVLEKIIPGAGRNLFVAFKPKIMQQLNAAVLRKVNEELSDPKVREIISGILQYGEPSAQ